MPLDAPVTTTTRFLVRMRTATPHHARQPATVKNRGERLVAGDRLAEHQEQKQETEDTHVRYMKQLMRKGPFQTDGVTFVNDPSQIVGLALAVNVAHDDVPHARGWLADVLHDARLQPATLLLELFQEHARHLIDAPLHA
ncbi:hypothetical protein JNW88_02375 [Micromonospora sp. ATA32]|nr:hypothetical protein [Micromonospora sp. ATA32]